MLGASTASKSNYKKKKNCGLCQSSATVVSLYPNRYNRK